MGVLPASNYIYVEGAVNTAYSLIYAAMRNEHLGSLREFNALISVHLHTVNERKIRDRRHSRAHRKHGFSTLVKHMPANHLAWHEHQE